MSVTTVNPSRECGRSLIMFASASKEATGPQQPQPKSDRNVAIDVLRGYCIVMMITSHTGTASWVNSGVHMFRFVSGAEGFVFLSGLVLGLVYRSKISKLGQAAYKCLIRRAAQIWAVHCVLVLSALALNPTFLRYTDLPSWRSLGLFRSIWLTASLQLQPGHMLNILPLYVFLLLGAPIIMVLLRRKLVIPILITSAAGLVYSQWAPGAGRWAHPASGGEAFPVVAWQAVFVYGLCIGWFRNELRDRILNPYRKQLTWAVIGACVLVMIGVSVQTPTFQFYNHEAWDLFLWERHPLRVGRVLYFLLALSSGYLAIGVWMRNRKLPRFPIEALSLLGRNSLYAFLVHLILAFFLDRWQIPPDRWFTLEAVPILGVAAVWFITRYQLARRWIPN